MSRNPLHQGKNPDNRTRRPRSKKMCPGENLDTPRTEHETRMRNVNVTEVKVNELIIWSGITKILSGSKRNI